MNRLACACIALAACGPASVHAAEPDASAVFAALKALVGDWRSADAASATRVSYSLTANGTTLVESWTMSPTRQSLTVYTMDGERLLATHYCPQGNAPRMQLEETDESGAHRFEFVDGANLQDPQGHHEHAFWIRVDAPGRVTRSETYIRNDAKYDPAKDTGTSESFERVK
jgi:hypothetical protein